jgi:hypothetical protein
MLKLLNILAIAYLAIAPGMNVDRLIHAVNLCRFADPAGHHQTIEASHHCGRSHAPRPEPEPRDECPHLHNVSVHATAMPVVQLQPVVLAATPTLNPPILEVREPASVTALAHDDPRPPPGPELVGIVILLV